MDSWVLVHHQRWPLPQGRGLNLGDDHDHFSLHEDFDYDYDYENQKACLEDLGWNCVHDYNVGYSLMSDEGYGSNHFHTLGSSAPDEGCGLNDSHIQDSFVLDEDYG